MIAEESLNFNIKLSGTFWNRRPAFSIWLDEHPIVQSEVSTDIQSFQFCRNLDQGYHELKIRLENKTINDTVVKDGDIIKDMLLNINDIEIEEISLGSLMWNGKYYLDQPHEYQGKVITSLDNCVNLGWNGTYVLSFTSPFYIWLLEHI